MKIIGTNLYRDKFNDAKYCRLNAGSLSQQNDKAQFGAVPFVNKAAVLRRLSRLSTLDTMEVIAQSSDKAERLIVCKFPDDVLAHIEKALGQISHLKHTDVKVRSEFIPIFFSRGNKARIGIQIVNAGERKDEILYTFKLVGARKQSTFELFLLKLIGEERIRTAKLFWILNKS